MTEAQKKVQGIDRLAIFPLPLVLMPRELLPLHIFEEKYREMLRDVSQTDNIFGINLFEPDEDFLDRPKLGSIGCAAEIREVHSLPDGRSNIVTLGAIRYRLIDFIDTSEPYLIGDVEFFEDLNEDPALLHRVANEVFEIFERIAKAAFKMSGNRGRFPEITRTDPESFSFLAAAAFNFENDFKYRLLEMTSTIERLEKLRAILEKTVDQMEENAAVQKLAQSNGHSKKKLDI